LVSPGLASPHLVTDDLVYLFNMSLTNKCMGSTLVLPISKELRPEKIKRDPDKIILHELPNTSSSFLMTCIHSGSMDAKLQWFQMLQVQEVNEKLVLCEVITRGDDEDGHELKLPSEVRAVQLDLLLEHLDIKIITQLEISAAPMVSYDSVQEQPWVFQGIKITIEAVPTLTLPVLYCKHHLKTIQALKEEVNDSPDACFSEGNKYLKVRLQNSEVETVIIKNRRYEMERGVKL
jgi:hypothetical protein